MTDDTTENTTGHVKDVDWIKFNVLRNALYHTGRRRFFETWNKIFNFVVILLGTAAVMSTATNVLGIDPRWVGVGVAFVGALQLVFDFGSAASLHRRLQRDYYHLLAEIEETRKPTEASISKWQAHLLRITADEPPTLRARDAKAYNDALDSMETYDEDQRLEIPWYQTILGGLFTFEGHSYRKLSELK